MFVVRSHSVVSDQCSMSAYWAVQVGLLTSFTFARYRLSPMAAFTSGAYFLYSGKVVTVNL